MKDSVVIALSEHLSKEDERDKQYNSILKQYGAEITKRQRQKADLSVIELEDGTLDALLGCEKLWSNLSQCDFSQSWHDTTMSDARYVYEAAKELFDGMQRILMDHYRDEAEREILEEHMDD